MSSIWKGVAERAGKDGVRSALNLYQGGERVERVRVRPHALQLVVVEGEEGRGRDAVLFGAA